MKGNSKKKSSETTPIENQVSTIFSSLVSNLPRELVALRAKPMKYATLCKGLINIYKKEELEKVSDNKRMSVRPMVMYAFFMKDYQESILESVAIYGGNLPSRYFALKRRGVLFGYKIAHLNVEVGARPFLDVKLAV